MSGEQNTRKAAFAGARLKRLREEKNLSARDVASRLHLKPRIIEALEQGDYDSLPNETYVRGYLRNYAKLLGESPDSILSLYEDDVAGPPEIVPEPEVEPEVEPEPEPPAEKKSAAAFLYFGAFVFLLLLFTWWRNPEITRTGIVADFIEKTQSVSEAPSQGLSYPVTIVEHPDTPFYRDPADEQAPAPGTDEAAEVIIPTVEIAESITRGSGPDSIRIGLETDSWIEIFDVNNEKVYYDLARAGQTLILNGAGPFSILLGAPLGATIEFNGVAFDLAPHMSGTGIARFTLGEDERNP